MSISISLKRCRCISVSVTSSVYPSFFSISYSCSLFSPSLYFLLPSLPFFRIYAFCPSLRNTRPVWRLLPIVHTYPRRSCVLLIIYAYSPSQLDVRPTIVMTFEDWERMTDHGRSGALGSPSFTQMCLRLIVDPYEQKQIRKQHRHTSTRTSATLARTVR